MKIKCKSIVKTNWNKSLSSPGDLSASAALTGQVIYSAYSGFYMPYKTMEALLGETANKLFQSQSNTNQVITN